ncbi:hypothetical protein SDC9_194135 [bioreactor metagenome]|uniref:Uncharacterized protein n=1 Tax=bioreactor metagenome TaxID=1076179 RepID=A0A645I6M3_9ZZZZ
MRRNGRRARELRVGMHAAHRIGHTVGSGARRHVVWMQRATRAAAAGHGEVLLAVLDAPLLIGARHGMLEARGIRGVAGDGNIHALMPHDGNAFVDVVRAIAANLRLVAV